MHSIYGIFISLLISAFFSGVEIAFLSANKLRIELYKKKTDLSARILYFFTSQPSRYLATILVGNTIALVIYGVFAAHFLEPYIHSMLPSSMQNASIVLLIQTAIATILVLFTAEFIPKSLFRVNPDIMLKVSAIPMFISYIILFPLGYLVSTVSKFIITKILKLEHSDEKMTYGIADLEYYIIDTMKNQDERKTEIDTKLFKNALTFNTIRVKECMVPRTDIVAVSLDDDIEELYKAFKTSNHSRILLYKNNIDNIVGFTHTLELFKRPKNITQVMYPITIVPETYHAHDLLNQFMSERKSIALVVDEYGGTSGMVTVEDIIEEIFGEIEDEHDDDEDIIEQRLDEKTFIFDAKIDIDDLNENYNLKIPEGDYETLGGYIIHVHQNIPEINELIEIYPLLFEIQSVSETKIKSVKVTILDQDIQL